MKEFELELVKPYKIKQLNENGKRYYQLPNGKKYPSVTTYLSSMSKDAIDKWKLEVGPEIASATSQRAMKRGNIVHKSVEKYMKADPKYLTEVVDSYKDMVNGLTTFLDNRVDKIYGIELPLYSTKLRSAGTADLFCRMDGVVTLADFKTAEHVKREAWITNYFYQATMYALMIYERYKVKVPQIAILIATEHDGLQVFKKPTKDYVDSVIDFVTNHELFPKG